ncbi:MAG: MFS transporter [Gammaproteobacteria bacterium]|nr:MFS transporter [Gammaproteobacteria bacterium]
MSAMTTLERRAVSSLAAIMSLRLLGLFMIIPIFSLYTSTLPGSTPFFMGLAMGIYGLTQGLFQIPFGMISDHLGRKPIILMGLIIFAIGSITAALAHNMTWMIIGRALQGAGAIGSTTIALIADLTRDNQRTKAMAINGMTIGMSFSLAMILGPILATWVHVTGIFWLAMLFSFIAIYILFAVTPAAPKATWHSDAEVEPTQFFALLKKPELARLNASVFLLHAIFTASFVVIPIGLKLFAGLASAQQWELYVPALFMGFSISIVCIVLAEKKQQVKHYFVAAIAILCLAEISLALWTHSLALSALSLFLFFTAFSLLEAFLPSWVSRVAPAARKGTALGIYSSSQFLGIFFGGSVGGWLYGAFGLQNVYLFCVALTLLWLIIAVRMQGPRHATPPTSKNPH